MLGLVLSQPLIFLKVGGIKVNVEDVLKDAIDKDVSRLNYDDRSTWMRNAFRNKLQSHIEIKRKDFLKSELELVESKLKREITINEALKKRNEWLESDHSKEVDRKILSIVCNELEDSERRMIGNKGEVAHILDKERKRISEFKETVRQMVYNV